MDKTNQKLQFLNFSTLEKAIELSSFFEKAILFDEIDSTNTAAKNLIINKFDEVAFSSGIVAANKQYAGRGRLGKSWLAESGKTMTFSLVFDKIDSYLLPFLTLLAAELVHSTLCTYNEIKHSEEKLTIKWPNDIFAGDKKICGILCESIYEANKLKAVIVGIGINISSGTFTTSDFKKAGSVKSVYGFTPNTNNLLIKIVNSVDKTFTRKSFSPKYINSFSYLKNKLVECEIKNTKKIAEVLEIDKMANLVVIDSNDIKHKIKSGTINIIS